MCRRQFQMSAEQGKKTRNHNRPKRCPVLAGVRARGFTTIFKQPAPQLIKDPTRTEVVPRTSGPVSHSAGLAACSRLPSSSNRDYQMAEEDGFVSASSGEPEQQDSETAVAVRNKGLMEHGCEHYRRRCKLVAPCCGEVFWCRHCHNQVKDDREQDPKKRHTLDRKLVQEVVCALCSCRQPVAEQCTDCGVRFGAYSCLHCNFFDDVTVKQQFHCNDCGICRVGGRSNFFHCSTCNCCYSMSMQGGHVCVTNSMHQNCPVCCEFLFDSIRPIAVLPCGHTIHQECHSDLMTHNTITCPLCLKCILGQDERARMWRYFDDQVRDTPMPDEYRNLKVTVLCNDCSQRSECMFHVVGHKCTSCGGYNTRRVGEQ